MRAGAAGGDGGGCLFLLARNRPLHRASGGARASRGHGCGGRRVGRAPCRPSAAPAETVSSGKVVSPRSALRKLVSPPRSFSYPLALSLARGKLLPFGRVDPSRAAGPLGSFRRAELLFFLREKHACSRSPRFLFLLETREPSLKFFPSSGLICSLSLGCREVITVVYYLVKDP